MDRALCQQQTTFKLCEQTTFGRRIGTHGGPGFLDYRRTYEIGYQTYKYDFELAWECVFALYKCDIVHTQCQKLRPHPVPWAD